MARTVEELLDELDELDEFHLRLPSARVPSRSVARALRLRASARKRAAAYRERSERRRAKIEAVVARMRGARPDPYDDPSQLS